MKRIEKTCAIRLTTKTPFGMKAGAHYKHGIALKAIVVIALVALHANDAFGQLPSQSQTKPTAKQGQSSPKASTYQLMIGTDMLCSVRVDDATPKELSPDEPVAITVGLGEHLVIAVTRDGKDRWAKVVQIVKPGKKIVLIGLAAVKEAREQAERAKKEETQAHARAVAEQLDRSQVRAEQARQVEQQQAVAEELEAKRKRIVDLQSQIADLQQQAADSESEAQENEQRAQEIEQQCATIRGPCANQLLIYTNRSEAQRKRQEARELKSQVGELQVEVRKIENE